MCSSISALPTFPTWLRILGVIAWWYMQIVYISASFRGFWQSFTAILSEYKPCFVSYYDLNFELKAYSLCKPNWLVYKLCPCFPAILTRCIKCQCQLRFYNYCDAYEKKRLQIYKKLNSLHGKNMCKNHSYSTKHTLRTIFIVHAC